MRLRSWVASLLFCLLLIDFAPRSQPQGQQSQTPASAAGQLPALTSRSHEERERMYATEHHMVLNVQVSDALGRPVRGLTAEDFALLDEGQPGSIDSVRAIDGLLPAAQVHAILVIDTINNNAKNLGIERRGIGRFLEGSQGRLAFPVSLAVLSASGMKVGPPSTDAKALVGELKGLGAGLRATECAEWDDFYVASSSLVALPGTVSSTDSRAGGCLNSSFEQSVSSLSRIARLEGDVPGRLILVWIGPGWPRLAGSQFKPDTLSRKRRFFDYLVELSTALREAQVTVDQVSSPELARSGERQGELYAAAMKGVASESQASAASMSLPVLARKSGGRVLDEDRNIAGHIAACLADGETFYSLSFKSVAAQKSAELRTLEVRVGKPGVTARTYTEYYARP